MTNDKSIEDDTEDNDVILKKYRESEAALKILMQDIIDSVSISEITRHFSYATRTCSYKFKVRKNNILLECKATKNPLTLVVELYKLSWWGLSKNLQSYLFWDVDYLGKSAESDWLINKFSKVIDEVDSEIAKKSERDLIESRLKKTKLYSTLSSELSNEK